MSCSHSASARAAAYASSSASPVWHHCVGRSGLVSPSCWPGRSLSSCRRVVVAPRHVSSLLAALIPRMWASSACFSSSPAHFSSCCRALLSASSRSSFSSTSSSSDSSSSSSSSPPSSRPYTSADLSSLSRPSIPRVEPQEERTPALWLDTDRSLEKEDSDSLAAMETERAAHNAAILKVLNEQLEAHQRDSAGDVSPATTTATGISHADTTAPLTPLDEERLRKMLTSSPLEYQAQVAAELVGVCPNLWWIRSTKRPVFAPGSDPNSPDTVFPCAPPPLYVTPVHSVAFVGDLPLPEATASTPRRRLLHVLSLTLGALAMFVGIFEIDHDMQRKRSSARDGSPLVAKYPSQQRPKTLTNIREWYFNLWIDWGFSPHRHDRTPRAQRIRLVEKQLLYEKQRDLSFS